jgi:hypothetical protein
MSGKGADKYQHSVSRFWHNYLSILEKSSVPFKARRWYRKHVEEYISAHQGVKLAHHLPGNVDKYLAAKGRIKSLQEWQFRQIADAHCLLFCEPIHPDWAANCDWYRWGAHAAMGRFAVLAVENGGDCGDRGAAFLAPCHRNPLELVFCSSCMPRPSPGIWLEKSYY